MTGPLTGVALVVLVLCIAAVWASLDGQLDAFFTLVSMAARVGLAGLAWCGLLAWRRRSGARS